MYKNTHYFKYLILKYYADSNSYNIQQPILLVHGGYSQWSSWGDCSTTCGIGVQQRIRQCNQPTPRHGGDDCTHLGPAQASQSCNLGKCPGMKHTW